MKTMFNQGRKVRIDDAGGPFLEGFAVLAWGHEVSEVARPGVVFKSSDPHLAGRHGILSGDRFEVI